MYAYLECDSTWLAGTIYLGISHKFLQKIFNHFILLLPVCI